PKRGPTRRAYTTGFDLVGVRPLFGHVLRKKQTRRWLTTGPKHVLHNATRQRPLQRTKAVDAFLTRPGRSSVDEDRLVADQAVDNHFGSGNL
ncbi:MAG: hypothetical protein QGG09_22190, partial [Pirellulaceae bacterium]|nr:hypothetical protein [Pirellulaceae bacterium]